MKVGAFYTTKRGCTFTVWAPYAKRVSLLITAPKKRAVAMRRRGDGYWQALVKSARPGTRYLYRVDAGEPRPDPASFSQPDGVHGASEVIALSRFAWNDTGWRSPMPEKMIIYELHVGTFTREGTFEAVIPRLKELKELGVNALELMPVAQFPGTRNWGYDGTYLYGVQNSYGGAEGLMKLVDAAHRLGIAVILDVVYNHLGPEGNYLSVYGPYFTDKYRAPWGQAINFDDRQCTGVRDFFIENALYWFRYFHIDGLRLDAIHGMFDMSAKHFLAELAEQTDAFCRETGRSRYLIAESDLNDARVVRGRGVGGFGIDAQWCDDFHHCLHALLTKEARGYYRDFGKLADLAKSYKRGFVYCQDYSVFRQRPHGSPPEKVPGRKFVVCSQNHDQVGNRFLGDRLSTLVGFEALKLAAGAVLTAPFIPLIFMGQEYGEEAPFLYFISHTDRALVKSVRDGRRHEFRSFGWKGDPPDAYAEEMFAASRLHWSERLRGRHGLLRSLYGSLIGLRRILPALAELDLDRLEAVPDEKKKTLIVCRSHGASRVMTIMNFNDKSVRLTTGLPAGKWKKALDSADQMWGGPGSPLPSRLSGAGRSVMRPFSFAIYVKGR